MSSPESNGFDWMHAISGLGGGVLGTCLTWFWRMARIEPQIRADIRAKHDATRLEMGQIETRVEAKIAEQERRGEARLDEHERRSEERQEMMIGHFHEAFSGIRQKINDVEKEALSREDFQTFRQEERADRERARAESRDDFKRLEDKVDAVLRQRAPH